MRRRTFLLLGSSHLLLLLSCRALFLLPDLLPLVGLALLDGVHALACLFGHDGVDAVPDSDSGLHCPWRGYCRSAINAVTDEPSQDGLGEGESVAAARDVRRDSQQQIS